MDGANHTQNREVKIVNKLKKRTILLDSGRIVKDYKEGEFKNESI